MAEVFDSRHARAAEASIGAQLDATRNSASAREAAQADIVRAFGSFIRGGGSGPTEEQIKQFAKLAAEEHRRRRRLADRLAARPADNEPKTPAFVVARPLRAVALLATWAVAIPIIVVAAFGPREAAFSPAGEKIVTHAVPAAPAVALAQAPQASPRTPCRRGAAVPRRAAEQDHAQRVIVARPRHRIAAAGSRRRSTRPGGQVHAAELRDPCGLHELRLRAAVGAPQPAVRRTAAPAPHRRGAPQSAAAGLSRPQSSRTTSGSAALPCSRSTSAARRVSTARWLM